jgi:DNA-binding transcriptional LysR family regulator
VKDLFNNLDLNLLKTFLIVYQEKNLQKASKKLFVSAPAISKALNKLRLHFDDPLFLKSSKGVVPTSFANDLAKIVAPTFERLSNDLNTLYEFDPGELAGKIHLAISPVLIPAIGKDLYDRVKRQAPDVELHLMAWNKATFDDLSSGFCRLGLNYDIPLSRKDIHSQYIVTDQFGVYVRKGHPLLNKTVSLDEVINYPIATMLIADYNFDEAFAIKTLRELFPHWTPQLALRSELPGPILESLVDSDILFPYTAFFQIDRYSELSQLDIDSKQTHKLLKHIHIYTAQKDRHDLTQQWLIEIVSDILNGYQSEVKKDLY